MKALLKWSFVLLIVLPVGSCLGHSVAQFREKAARDKENMARGEKVVAAIRAFEAAAGSLPSGISDVRSSRVGDVPVQVGSGREFGYHATDGEFYVEFAESGFGIFTGDGFYRYSSQEDSWHLHFP